MSTKCDNCKASVFNTALHRVNPLGETGVFWCMACITRQEPELAANIIESDEDIMKDLRENSLWREEEMKAMKCYRDGVEMEPSKALQNTWVYCDDFGNDAGSRGSTMSRIGPPVLIDCLKCPHCGHSVTIGVDTPDDNGTQYSRGHPCLHNPLTSVFGLWWKKFSKDEFAKLIPREDTRPRCKVTGKVIYTRQLALDLIEKAKRNAVGTIAPKRSYRCRHCGYFHLTKIETYNSHSIL